MRAAFIAGLAYFALVFAAGFALGGLRLNVLEPRFGPLGAVLVELPFMLAVSWFACGWAVRRFKVPRAFPARLGMGASAFAFLMAAELGLSVFLFGQSVSAFLAGFAAPAGAAGLAGQIVFGLMPMMRK